MTSNFRALLLASILAAVLALVPAANAPLAASVQTFLDLFDKRLQTTVLFVGNSRTYYNDMPAMVRKIADSAGAPERYRVEMYAPGGRTLADHLADPTVQELLSRHWDRVVFQAQSGEQYSDYWAEKMVGTATQLIKNARGNGAKPVMFVTWRYGDDYAADNVIDAAKNRNMHVNIQDRHRQLADETGVDLVNVGAVWEDLQSQGLGFSLYDDGNHPSIYGSYLAALMFYANFSGGDVHSVTYIPRGIRPDQADVLKAAVSGHFAKAAG